MKIECDKCQAKYQIADEKVRGKTFKIRCKKCSNVIIVRNKAAVTPEEDSAPAAAAEPTGWHLAVDGETVGPVSAEEVRAKYDAGEIDKDTSVWQEGFEDWISLRDATEFVDLPERAITSAPVAAPVAAAPATAAAELVSPRVDADRMTGQRNENSVLFSLDNLRQIAAQPSPATAPVASSATASANASSVPTSEGSGLIDIRALSAMAAAPAASNSAAFGGASTSADAPSLMGGLGGLGSSQLESSLASVATPEPNRDEPAAAVAAPPAKDNKNVIIGVMGAAMGAAMLILLGVVFATGGDKEEKADDKTVAIASTVKAPTVEKPDNSKEKKKEDEKAEDKPEEKKEDEKAKVEAGKDGEAEKKDEAAEAKVEADAGVASSSKSGTTKKKSSVRKKKATTKKKKKKKKTEVVAEVEPAPKKKNNSADCLIDPDSCKQPSKKKSTNRPPSRSTSSGALNEKLDRTDLSAGVRQVKASAKKCGKKHGGAPGTKVHVKMSVQGSTGRVASAAAVGEYAGKSLGNCVAKAAKKAKFKKFKAAQQGFTFPFRM